MMNPLSGALGAGIGGVLSQSQSPGILAQMLAQQQRPSYDTQLSPQDEMLFRQRFPDPRETQDYDMRGAWKAGITQGGNGHYPDTYKKPWHPTLSDESKYHGVDGHFGGHWEDLGNDKWRFTAGPANIKNIGVDAIRSYLERSDPNVELVLPR